MVPSRRTGVDALILEIDRHAGGYGWHGAARHVCSGVVDRVGPAIAIKIIDLASRPDKGVVSSLPIQNVRAGRAYEYIVVVVSGDDVVERRSKDIFDAVVGVPRSPPCVAGGIDEG